MSEPHDPAYNRDDQQKPGATPRPATEPKGAEGQSKTPKTLTDPATGASQGESHAPNQAKADQTDGVKRPASPGG